MKSQQGRCMASDGAYYDDTEDGVTIIFQPGTSTVLC